MSSICLWSPAPAACRQIGPLKRPHKQLEEVGQTVPQILSHSCLLVPQKIKKQYKHATRFQVHATGMSPSLRAPGSCSGLREHESLCQQEAMMPYNILNVPKEEELDNGDEW